MTRLQAMAERAERTRQVQERSPPTVHPELKGRVLREAEWLNPALGRATGKGGQ